VCPIGFESSSCSSQDDEDSASPGNQLQQQQPKSFKGDPKAAGNANRCSHCSSDDDFIFRLRIRCSDPSKLGASKRADDTAADEVERSEHASNEAKHDRFFPLSIKISCSRLRAEELD